MYMYGMLLTAMSDIQKCENTNNMKIWIWKCEYGNQSASRLSTPEEYLHVCWFTL